MKLRMFRGLPGSGKTTLARRLVADLGSAGRINRDDLRAMLFDGKWTGPREKIVVECEKAIALVLAAHGNTPLIDDTNLTPHHSAMWQDFAKLHGLDFEIDQRPLATPFEECLRRNLNRSGAACVPEPVITRMAIQAGIITFDRDIIIFDLDGTLADMQHRTHLVDGSSQPKNWDACYAQLHNDTPVDLVCRWMNAEYDSGNVTVLIVSGRPDTYWRETKDWLLRHNLRYHYLLMRSGSDRRDDTVVKKAILDILPKEKIICAVDDRPRVLKMWCSEGLRVVPVRGQIEDF